jgi:hypothetical protein
MSGPATLKDTINDALSLINSPFLDSLLASGSYIALNASTSTRPPVTGNLEGKLAVLGGFEAILYLAERNGRGGLVVVKAGTELGALHPKHLHGAGSAFLVDVGSGPLVSMSAMNPSVGKGDRTIFAVRTMSVDIKRPVPIPGVLVYHVEFKDGERIFKDLEAANAIETEGMVLTLDVWTEWMKGEKMERPRPLVSATSVNPRVRGLSGLVKPSKL